jgi:hypothetical protein
MKRRRAGCLFLLPLLGLVIWMFPWRGCLVEIGRWLDVGEVPQRVEYVFVLPGDWSRRPFVAAALCNTGFAQIALIPRTKDSPDEASGLVLRNSEVIRRVLRHRGVEEDRIRVLQGASESTAGDLKILAGLLESEPETSLAIVTSAYHTRRTRWTARRFMGPQNMGRIIFISAPNPGFDVSSWWRTEEGFRRITTEYVKLLAYWLWYGNGMYLCLTLLAIAAVLSVIARLFVRHRSWRQKVAT